MIETALLMGASCMKRREPFDDNDPNHKRDLLDHFATWSSTARYAIHLVALVVSVACGVTAYRCNGKSLLWGLFGFFFPVIYILIHAFHDFECAKHAKAGRSGRSGRSA